MVNNINWSTVKSYIQVTLSRLSKLYICVCVCYVYNLYNMLYYISSNTLYYMACIIYLCSRSIAIIYTWYMINCIIYIILYDLYYINYYNFYIIYDIMCILLHIFTQHLRKNRSWMGVEGRWRGWKYKREGNNDINIF